MQGQTLLDQTTRSTRGIIALEEDIKEALTPAEHFEEQNHQHHATGLHCSVALYRFFGPNTHTITYPTPWTPPKTYLHHCRRIILVLKQQMKNDTERRQSKPDMRAAHIRNRVLRKSSMRKSISDSNKTMQKPEPTKIAGLPRREKKTETARRGSARW